MSVVEREAFITLLIGINRGLRAMSTAIESAIELLRSTNTSNAH